MYKIVLVNAPFKKNELFRNYLFLKKYIMRSWWIEEATPYLVPTPNHMYEWPFYAKSPS
jgi:hypothetical protein